MTPVMVSGITYGKLRTHLTDLPQSPIAAGRLNLPIQDSRSMERPMSKERKVYRCQNRDCGCEFVVTKTSGETKKPNPRCFCGAEIKKPYSPPVLRTRELERNLTS